MKDICDKDTKIFKAITMRERADCIEREAKQPFIDVMNILMRAANEQPADGQPPADPKTTELQDTVRVCIADLCKIEKIDMEDLEAPVSG